MCRGVEAQDIYSGTLGELLCRKADEGVQVKVLIFYLLILSGSYSRDQCCVLKYEKIALL
jgi:hypothetical protein